MFNKCQFFLLLIKCYFGKKKLKKLVIPLYIPRSEEQILSPALTELYASSLIQDFVNY